MKKIKNIYLSVITVVKNDQYGLEKTYNSLQIFKKFGFYFEWILIDGSSIPLNKSFIKKKDTIIIEEEDFGIYNAMNKGIDLATGKFLIFLNAGDTLINSKQIRNLEGKLRKNNVDVICFSWKTIINKKAFLKKSYLRKNKFSRLLRMPSSHQAMLYKKEKLKTNKFDESFLICGDFAMYLNSLSKMWKYKIYDKNYFIEFSTEGISTKKPILLARESSYAIFKYSNTNLFIKIFISGILIIRAILRYFFIKIVLFTTSHKWFK